MRHNAICTPGVRKEAPVRATCERLLSRAEVAVELDEDVEVQVFLVVIVTRRQRRQAAKKRPVLVGDNFLR